MAKSNNTGTLVVVGSTNMDLSIRVPHFPKSGQTIAGDDLTQGLGGKGANQAVAASRAGVKVTFLTGFGSDTFGSNCKKKLQKEKIELKYAQTFKEVPSGSALIFVSENGENMIAVSAGANGKIEPKHLHDLSPVLKKAKFALAQLEVPFAVVGCLAGVCKQTGSRLILNPAPCPKTGLPNDLLERVNYLTPNRSEFKLLAGCDANSDAGKRWIKRWLTKQSHFGIVVTLGKAGALVWEKGMDNAKKIAGMKVTAVDTVGAGDCFSGYMAAGLANGMSLVDACDWANRAAALSVTQAGALSSIPKSAAIDKFFLTV